MPTPKILKKALAGVGPAIALFEVTASALDEMSGRTGAQGDEPREYLREVLGAARGEKKEPHEVVREILQDLGGSFGLIRRKDLEATMAALDLLENELAGGNGEENG